MENIIFDGLITRIAITLCCDLHVLEEVRGSSKFDLDICLVMKIIVRESGRYCLALRDYLLLPLSDPDHTMVRDHTNWRMIRVALVPTPIVLPDPLSSRSEPTRHSFAFGYTPADYFRVNFTDFYTSIDVI